MSDNNVECPNKQDLLVLASSEEMVLLPQHYFAVTEKKNIELVS